MNIQKARELIQEAMQFVAEWGDNTEFDENDETVSTDDAVYYSNSIAYRRLLSALKELEENP